MFHAVASVIFIALFATWIKLETRHQADLWRCWIWVMLAAVAAISGSVLDLVVGGKAGNFLLHAVGGGVASAFLFVYLVTTFQPKINWRIKVVALFAFVSVLGVLNELLEYGLEFVTPWIMSIDSHDTWRDFVANTSGAFVAWSIVNLLAATRSTSKKQG